MANAQGSGSRDPGRTERPGAVCCMSGWTSVWLGTGIGAERSCDRAPRAHVVRCGVRGDGSLIHHPPMDSIFLAGSPPGSEAHTPAVSLGSPAPSRVLCASPVPFPDSGPGVPWEGGRAPCRAAVRSGQLPARVLGGGGRSAVHAACNVCSLPHMQPAAPQLRVVGHAASWSAEGSRTGPSPPHARLRADRPQRHPGVGSCPARPNVPSAS